MTATALHTLPAFRLQLTLERLGFQPTEQSARHIRYVHPDGRRTLLPRANGTEIGCGLLRRMLRDLRLPPGELDALF